MTIDHPNLATTSHSALVLPYGGVHPVIAELPRAGGPGTAVLGRVTLGRGAALAPWTVIRADGHVVDIGEDLFLGERSTIHIAHDRYGTTLGHHVSVGAYSVVHACTVGDDCVVQDRVAVLDGAVVGAGSIVAAGSVVFPRTELPPGHWCEGSPAKPVRPLEAGELRQAHDAVRAQRPGADRQLVFAADGNGLQVNGGPRSFVAFNVVGHGRLRVDADASVWYGCVVEAAPGLDVAVGAGANVQDNTVMRATGRSISVGADTTIGHNVVLHDCAIGAAALVGMGSVVAPGTVVADGAFLAGGTHTQPGQVLEGGWLWGGRPARALSPLKPQMAEVIRSSAAVYRDYAADFGSQAGSSLVVAG